MRARLTPVFVALGVSLALVMPAQAESAGKVGTKSWGRSNTVAEQPITRHANGAITTPVYINRKGPFEFLVDTGAAISGIDRVVVAANNLAYEPVREVDIMGAAGRSTMRILRFKSLISSVFEIKNPQLLELPRSFQSARSVDKGVLGTDFWANHTVVFDLERDKILLYPKTFDLTEGLPDYFDTIPMRYSKRDNGIFARVKLNGKSYTALIDTGASLTFVDKKLAKRLKIDQENGYRETATGISGRSVGFYRTKLGTLQAGTRTWNNVSIGLMEFPRGTKHNLVIGMNLLAAESFAVDYGHKRILLVKPERKSD